MAWRTLAPAARIQVANRRTLRPATVVATLRARVPARVTVTYPTGVQQQVLVTARGTTVSRLLLLRPGTSTIRLTAVAADARTPAAELGLQALDPAVLESGFVPFL